MEEKKKKEFYGAIFLTGVLLGVVIGVVFVGQSTSAKSSNFSRVIETRELPYGLYQVVLISENRDNLVALKGVENDNGQDIFFLVHSDQDDLANEVLPGGIIIRDEGSDGADVGMRVLYNRPPPPKTPEASPQPR